MTRINCLNLVVIQLTEAANAIEALPYSMHYSSSNYMILVSEVLFCTVFTSWITKALGIRNSLEARSQTDFKTISTIFLHMAMLYWLLLFYYCRSDPVQEDNSRNCRRWQLAELSALCCPNVNIWVVNKARQNAQMNWCRWLWYECHRDPHSLDWVPPCPKVSRSGARLQCTLES